MTAGPVEVHEDILDALAEPTLPHYGPHFKPLYEDTLLQVQRLFQTRNDVLLIPGPGTSALDAGIGSLISPYSGICVPVNGFFGDRVRQIVEAYGIDAYPVEFVPGTPVDPEVVRQKLKEWIPESLHKGRPMRALAVVHHETSTGVLNPLKELSEVAQEFGLLMIVDAVASMGGVNLPVDEWGIDVCVTVPNKCLGAPPGVAMLSVSPDGWHHAEENPAKHGWYHDLRTWAWFREHERDWHPYPTTLPTNVIAALNKSLHMIFDKGVDVHRAEIQSAADTVRAGLNGLGFEMFPDPEYAAPVLSAFYGLPEMQVSEMMRTLRDEQGLMISGGLGDYMGRIFRIGHMGMAASRSMSDEVVAGIRAYLETARSAEKVGAD
jgi:alanine-glyoxylate transaminase/serine-glyoxylate transaminase/serine-pyruvate transaminase